MDGDSVGSIRFNCNVDAVLPRGSGMIRRIAVPPWERLDPLLPQRAGSDAATREVVARILEDVLTRGDEAVREHTLRLDGVDLAPRHLGAGSRRMAGGDGAGGAGPPRRPRPGRRPGARIPPAPARRGFSPYRRRRQLGGDEGDPAGSGRPLHPRRQGVVPVLGGDERGARRGRGRKGDRGGGAAERASPMWCWRRAPSPGSPGSSASAAPRRSARSRSAPPRCRGWTRSSDRATAGWRKPSGRWSAGWAST